MTPPDTTHPSLTNRVHTSHGSRSTTTDDATATIVLGVSGTSEDHLDVLAATTAELAGTMDAAVHVVHAFTVPGFESALDYLDFDTESLPHPDEVARRFAAIRDVTDRLRSPARDGKLRVELHGRIGEDTGATIVSFADELDADRVVVGGRSRSPTGKALFGSTAQHVLLNADCPVTFVKDV